jgi:carbamoyltransferase
LFDPRVKNGKDIVNKVKKREWFRPFGCSVLEEEAHKWFDMQGLKESPYMLYGVQCLPDKKDLIPSVVHADNSCRIQTVNEKQNKVLYNILKEFFKKTNVPILLNTSFNLSNEPLVETHKEAIDVFTRSDIDVLYFPEIEEEIKKR